MDKKQSGEIRIYGFGVFSPLINWLVFMLLCSELLLIKFLFFTDGIYIKPFRMTGAAILILLLLLWLLLVKAGKLKCLIIKGNEVKYISGMGRVKQCSWEDVDLVNETGLDVSIWLNSQERFAGFNKYTVGVEVLMNLYKTEKS